MALFFSVIVCLSFTAFFHIINHHHWLVSSSIVVAADAVEIYQTCYFKLSCHTLKILLQMLGKMTYLIGYLMLLTWLSRWHILNWWAMTCTLFQWIFLTGGNIFPSFNLVSTGSHIEICSECSYYEFLRNIRDCQKLGFFLFSLFPFYVCKSDYFPFHPEALICL